MEGSVNVGSRKRKKGLLSDLLNSRNDRNEWISKVNYILFSDAMFTKISSTISEHLFNSEFFSRTHAHTSREKVYQSNCLTCNFKFVYLKNR